ncbi:substrate-binding periplasmic protein [Zooshikella sp. RANM57]|uniref:substrate-binding periplasmic protein n=1 Tax=Zooshikella sp. RANM57 TaxID=3425863 RepID=UPI003D6E1EDE
MMKKIIVVLSALLMFSELTHAAKIKVLRADFRERPPLMFLVNGKPGGPLVDVLNLVAKEGGYRISWRKSPFQRSIKDIKLGSVDIIPRVSLNEEREKFLHFLGPVGYRLANTLFLTEAALKAKISSYNNLYSLVVGAKRGSFYFEEFNNDDSLNKKLYGHYSAMARALSSGEVNVLAVIESDRKMQEQELGGAMGSQYVYADYVHVRKEPVYFALSKKSPYANQKDALNSTIQSLISSGQIKAIYSRHNVTFTAK